MPRVLYVIVSLVLRRRGLKRKGVDGRSQTGSLLDNADGREVRVEGVTTSIRGVLEVDVQIHAIVGNVFRRDSRKNGPFAVYSHSYFRAIPMTNTNNILKPNIDNRH